MIVKMKDGSGPVSIRLTIRGIADWAYLVSSPDHTFRAQGTSSTPIDLELGKPTDLVLEAVEWTIHLANGAAADVDYSVTLDFRQDAKTLDTWMKSDKIKSADEVILDDRAVLIVGKV
jgi:hypothetical protein